MRVLVLGDAIIDHYLFGVTNRQSPEDLSIPIIDVRKEEYRLGGMLNVAANIKSLNKNIDVYVSTIASYFTYKLLRKRNIVYKNHYFGRVNYNSPDKDSEIIKTRIIDLKSKKQLMRTDNKLRYNSKDIKFYRKDFDFFCRLNEYDSIIISDYNKKLIDNFVLNKLKKYKNGPIFVDTKKRDLSIWKDFYNCFIKINWEEFQKSKKHKTLKNLIITHGLEPTQLRNYGKIIKEFEVNKAVQSPDVIGAGDVFLSGLVVNFLLTQNLDEAIKFASEVASESVKKQGTVEIYRKGE